MFAQSDHHLCCLLQESITLLSNFHTGFKEHEEAAYFAQQTGSFEVMNSQEADHKMVMRQMVQGKPIYWCAAEKLGLTVNFIGSDKW